MRLVIGLIFAILFCLIGCGDKYDESDIVAETTWEKMTINEKSMYEKIQYQWGQSKLKYIREAVRARKIKPDSDAIPFYDLAKLIKTTNDVNMIPADMTNNAESQKKYEAKKFSNIDPKWYYRYIDPQGGNFNKKETITNSGFKKPVAVKAIPKVQKTSITKVKNVKTYSVEDLISIKEYSKVKKLIRVCDEARAILEQVVSAGRPVTKIDFESIKERALYCKTVKLLED